LFAQDVLSFPSPITPVHPIINAGLGFGLGWGYLGSMGIPPIVASVDVPVNAGIPLSFGLGVGFTSIANVLNIFPILGRAALHLNFGVPGLDVYPVVSLGYALYFWDASYWGGGYLGGGGGAFAFGIAGGVRYFFNDNIGVWAELGYSQLTIISGGVTFTFGGNKGSSSSSSSRYMLVNTDTINVRSGPSADNPIVGTLARNTRVEVLDRSGTWWRIRSGNIQGYVNSSLLREEN
jgi:hypothetical protein